MIFLTVGTHEQPFNRLLKEIEILIESGIIQEEVVVQSGFSSYHPRKCTLNKFIPYDEMLRNIADARIVITHGGPASFIIPLREGKVPIVVPRQKQFGEHINDHQMEFSRAVEERQGTIIVIEDIRSLKDAILNYELIIKSMPTRLTSNNENFNKKFEGLVEKLF